jgi:NADH-quinone oxidoreductase subunit J
MNVIFYLAAAVAIFSTLMMLTRLNAIHALLYLVVSFLAVAVVMYALGAPFIAALEVIVYAGAIMVLFLFVVMLLNLGERATEMERAWLSPGMWVGPGILAAILLGEIVYLMAARTPEITAAPMGPKQVGIALFGPYVLGVELASLLLLAGLVGANHLGWRTGRRLESRDDLLNSDESRTASGGDLVHAGAGRDTGTAEHPVYPDVR